MCNFFVISQQPHARALVQHSSTHNCQLSSEFMGFSSYSLLKHVQYLVNTHNYEENSTFCQHDTSSFTFSFRPM